MAKLLSKEGEYATCAEPVYVHVKNDDSVLESKNGLRMAKHCFWAASLMEEYAKITHRFVTEIGKDAEQAKNRGFMYFFKHKKASLCELKKVFDNYFSNANNFYSYVIHTLYKMWIGNMKRRLK